MGIPLQYNPLLPVNKGQRRFAEYLDRQGLGPQSFQFNSESGQMSIVVDVPWADLFDQDDPVVPDFLGYSYTEEYKDAVGVKHRLRRTRPVQCPYFPWLWCTDVRDGRGVKFTGKDDTGDGGVFSTFDRCRMTLVFSSLPYRVMADWELDTVWAGQEFYRYLERHPKPTAEYITVDNGRFFEFAEGTDLVGPPARSFALGQGVINVKVDLELTWHHVPDDYLFKTLPGGPNVSQFGIIAPWVYRAMATVNASEFLTADVGTLLMLPPEITPEDQPVDPRVLGFGTVEVPPRAWKVKLPLKYWNPPLAAGATTKGHNTALDVTSLRFAKIRAAKGTATVYGSSEFADIFKPAGDFA